MHEHPPGERGTTMSAASDAAHRYAEHGWPVFPVRPGEKLPLIPSAHQEGDPPCSGECGREGHGFHDAVTDHRVIARWWGRAPEANVGIATGAPGPDVVDVDLKPGKSGFGAWNEAKAAGLVGGAAAIIRTPSGGMHAYFAGTDQRSASCKTRALDFRSRGGYVVAPPSRSAERGRPYEVVSHQPSDVTVDWAAIRALVDPQPERPAWTPRGDRPTELAHLPGWVASIPQGQGLRNQLNFWAMCRAAEAGDPALMDEICRAAIGNGKSEREVMASRRSAERRAVPQAEPRPFGRTPQRELEAG
jgi:Bifunctional DNA primase/polymerase, N-terminal